MIRGVVRFLVCCGGAAVGFAQVSPNSAVFDVASVKQLEQSLQGGVPYLSFLGNSGKPFKIAGNRVTWPALQSANPGAVPGGTLHALIADAYGVKTYQISGLPSWADSLLFTVTATTPGATEPTQDEVRPMLRALLADRFQLKFHHDTKEMNVYHMIQVKKSNAFKAATPGETFSWNLTPGPAGTLRSKATKESIGDFVQLVGVSTDKPVIDKTGLTGEIDYDILITLPEGNQRTPDETNREIVYAVVDQLGLKLESAKDAVEMLAIDNVEKPSAN
jgi:uncharacterized protein (TIGR03435 family)